MFAAILAASGTYVGSITFGVKALFGYVEYLPPGGELRKRGLKFSDKEADK